MRKQIRVSIASPPTEPGPEKRKVVYIAGPITGVPDHQRAFNQAEDELMFCGYIPLNPSDLPKGMTKAQYMRICFAMIDSADAVLVLPGWEKSYGAGVEVDYTNYVGKPLAGSMYELEEVLKNA